MRTSTPPRLTAADAEHLLDGGDGPAALRQLLAAAAGPGAASDLAGEKAAVAAFVAARPQTPLPSDPLRRPSMLSTALSKILAAKALAAVVLVAGATGGVALAANATTGSEDRPATSTSTERAPELPDTAADQAVPGGGDNGAAGAGSDGPQGTPAPALDGICTALTAGAVDNPGAAAGSPAFEALADQSCPEGTAPGRSGEAPGGKDDRPTGPADTPAGDGPALPEQAADSPAADQGTSRPTDGPAARGGAGSGDGD